MTSNAPYVNKSKIYSTISSVPVGFHQRISNWRMGAQSAAAYGLRWRFMRPYTCNLKYKLWRPCINKTLCILCEDTKRTLSRWNLTAELRIAKPSTSHKFISLHSRNYCLLACLARHCPEQNRSSIFHLLPYVRGGEPIYYNRPHKSWIIADGPQIRLHFILKFYLYLTRDKGFLWHSLLS